MVIAHDRGGKWGKKGKMSNTTPMGVWTTRTGRQGEKSESTVRKAKWGDGVGHRSAERRKGDGWCEAMARGDVKGEQTRMKSGTKSQTKTYPNDYASC